MQTGRRRSIALLFSMALMAGCGGDSQEPVTLRPDAFFRPSTLQQPENSRRTAIDQPRALTYDTVRMDLFRPQDAQEVAPAPVTAMDPEAERLIPSPPAATRPLPPLGTGVAMAIGRVAVEVNGQPIFSRRVLQPIEPDLAADAKNSDPETFRKIAAEKIRRQIDFLIRTELEVAAAKRNLAPAEIALADAVTMQWRQRQVTEAGGSVELARQRAAAEGTTFEEKTEDEYRSNLVRVYYQKRLFPRVQVTADDMRRYYERNLKSEFTEREQAQFRLIKVDIKKMGNRGLAEKKAQELLARARSGEDFATIAKDYNDDARLRGLGGDVGMIDRGAFALSKVEDAVWNLSPGEVGDIIEDRNAFYIVKLEQKKEGRTQSFDEEAVQDKIRATLRGQQFEQLREKQREQLLQGAVVNPYPPKIEPLLEIVMQKYPYWAMAD